MRYTIWKVGEEEYRLRLSVAECVALEKRLGGRNPMDLLMGVQEGKLPTLTASLALLQSAMQYDRRGVSAQEVGRLYERYLDEGNSYTDLLTVIMEVFEVSGFFRSDPAALKAENGLPTPDQNPAEPSENSLQR